MTIGQLQAALYEWQVKKRLDSYGYVFQAELRDEASDRVEVVIWKKRRRRDREDRVVLRTGVTLGFFETAADVHTYAEGQLEKVLQT